MQIRQLEYIVMVADTSSFAKAAKNLHVSQSAISQSIIKLEDELGVKIFNRLVTGVTPTKIGHQLIATASKSLEKINEMQDLADKHKRVEKEELNIGLVTGLHLPSLPKILSTYKKRFQGSGVAFKEKGSMGIIKSIIDKELDFGIVAIYENTLGFQSLISFKELKEIEYYVLAGKDTPLSNLESVGLTDLVNQKFVMYDGEFMSWLFLQYQPFLRDFELLYTTKNVDIIRETVRDGLAITIEVTSELGNNPFIKSGEVIAIPLYSGKIPKSYLGIAMLKDRVLSTKFKSLLSLLEYEMQK